MEVIKFQRGATPTSRARLASATPHEPVGAIPPAFIRLPTQLSMWGNDVFGDCVTAEEAFAIACHAPEIFVGYHKAVKWARQNWALNGAGLWEIMKLRQTEPIYIGAHAYTDGPFVSVDWTKPAILQDAIYRGPVKLGVTADQFETVAPTIGNSNGWVLTGLSGGPQDHCTSLCGYGPAGWLANKLGAASLNGIAADAMVYAMFTWSTVGIIDEPSLMAITGEAWLRTPTTIVRPNV